MLIWNLANISVISWSFSKIFLLKIGLISIYKMPPHLPSYLIRALSNLSLKIQSEGISNIGSMNLFQCARMELGQYLCYQLDFLLDFFTEDKSYQYLQDATLFALLSDKSAK